MIPPGAGSHPLTRTRKLAFAAITLMLLLGSLEISARAYAAMRFGNAQALTYGGRFLRAALTGDLQPPAANERPVVADAGTEEIYARRADRSLAVKVRPPMDVMLDGHPAHFNNLGLRGPDIDLADSKRLRLGLLGGSDTFGVFLEDRETWAHLLQSRLQRAGVAVDVLNAAVNGHNIDAVLRTMIALAHAVRIDYLLVTSAYNNRHLLPMERRYTLARRADWYLYNLSMFHVMVKEKLALWQRQPIDYGLYRQSIRVDPEAVAAWKAMYERRLDQLATVAREQHLTLVLSTQGELFQDLRLNELSTLDESAVNAIGQRIDRHEEVWLSELEFFMQGTQNLAVKRFTQAHPDVLFFDGAAVLHDDKARYFLDPIHPGPLGAARLAAALADFFTPLLHAQRE